MTKKILLVLLGVSVNIAVAVGSAMFTLGSRVQAVEVRVDERAQDIKEIRQQVEEIHRYLLRKK